MITVTNHCICLSVPLSQGFRVCGVRMPMSGTRRDSWMRSMINRCPSVSTLICKFEIKYLCSMQPAYILPCKDGFLWVSCIIGLSFVTEQWFTSSRWHPGLYRVGTTLNFNALNLNLDSNHLRKLAFCVSWNPLVITFTWFLTSCHSIVSYRCTLFLSNWSRISCSPCLRGV